MLLPLTSVAAPSLVINGHEYTLSLQKNERLTGEGEHFIASVEGYPEAWGRVSNFGGRWVGVVSLSGEKFRIDMPAASAQADDGKARVQVERLNAESVESYMDAPGTQCGAQKPVSIQQPSPQKQSALHTPIAQQVQFSQLCNNTVDGQCVLAELELVFDQQYQNVLGSEAQAAANSMINIIDGIYQNDLNVSFDVLTTHFLTSPVFSNTTEAGDLLDDIQAKKSGLSFVNNQQGLLHLVTGRNFDGGTAGIAFSDVLCDNSGYGVGTSQLLASGGGSDYVSLTSLIIAHELGHNFGAGHDGEDNSCATGFIMEPTISSSNQSFSSCSVQEMRATIENLSESQITSCFNFPVSVAINAASSNPSQVDAGVDFTSAFTVSTETAFRSLPALTVSGSVDASNARISSVTAGGSACNVNSDGASYECEISNPGATISLEMTAQGLNGEANFTHTLAYQDTELKESDTSDNSVQHQVSVNGTAQPQPPAQPPAPQPPANNGSSDSGGGGGGAAGFGLTLILLSVLGLRRRMELRNGQ
jgi:hypothetical protein